MNKREAWARQSGMDTAPTAPVPVALELPRVGRGASLEEIEALYLRDRLRFVRVAARIIGDPHDANDAVQDAFAQAVRARRSFRGSGSLEAWLWRFVVNSAHSSRRRRKDVPAGLDPTDGMAAVAAGYEFRDAARQAIAALPERQRLVLFLRYYADLDYGTIGDILGLRTGTVSSTLSHAHRAVRAALTEATE